MAPSGDCCKNCRTGFDNNVEGFLNFTYNLDHFLNLPGTSGGNEHTLPTTQTKT